MAKDLLTVQEIAAAKPSASDYKLRDGGGLYLLIRTDGRRFWRYRFTHGGKESMASLGELRRVNEAALRAARKLRDKARDQILDGVSPTASKRAEQQANEGRFSEIAADYTAEHFATLDADTSRNERKRLEYLTAELDKVPLPQITPVILATAIRTIKEQHGHDGAKRCHGLANRIWARAVLLGKAPNNPAAGFKARDAIGKAQTRNHPGITKPKRFGELLRAIATYTGSPVTRTALLVQASCFVRPGKELTKARWSEFDLDAALWTIPATRMKMKREHLVPLSTQVVAILRELAKLTERGSDSFVFAGLKPGKPISENTLNAALRALDFDTRAEHCAHGFRTSASTMISEQLKKPTILGDAIEAQLAHKKPGTAGVYNRAEHFEERVTMMQRWSDYLDSLRG